MSTFSKNLFDILGDGEAPRPAPVKEEAAPVVVDKKTVSKINKDAARSAKGGKPTKGRQQKEGRPQRGRQFDRHSGTGIVDTTKKINKGWGKAGASEAEGAKDTLNPADPDAPEQQQQQEPVVVEEEEEEKVKTLDEYLAEKANKALKVSLPEARKANDADSAAFEGTVAFAKEEFEEFYKKEEIKTVKKTTEKVRKEKVVVDIEQRFAEKARPEFRKNNDRRGGRPNANKGRRGPKNTAGSNANINLQDVAAFPTLGATA